MPRPEHRSAGVAVRRLVATVLLALSVPPLAAAETGSPGAPPEIVARAIERMARIDVEGWSYRRVLESREGRRVDRHVPGPDPALHWRLESVDGRPPTAEELEEYREEQQEHGRRGGAQEGDGEERVEGDGEGAVDERAADLDGDGRISPAERVAGWFDPASFERSAQEPRRWGFRLRSPDGRRESAWAQMHGELRIAGPVEAPWIDRARLWSTEPFFAAFGVRMTEVSAEVRFEKDGEHIRPLHLSVAFSGRAFFVRDVDERFTFTFDAWRAPDVPGAEAGDDAP